MRGRGRVKPGERIAWLALAVLYTAGGEVEKGWAIKTLSERLMLTERQVRNILSMLLDRGYVEPVVKRWRVWGLRVTARGEELLQRILGLRSPR